MSEFNEQFAPSAPAVFYRSYSRRKEDGSRENYKEAIERTVTAIAEVGNFNKWEKDLCMKMAQSQHCLPSGRSLWVAGTEWAKNPDNFPGFYNCCSMHVEDIDTFGTLMELAMMGTGTGAVLENTAIERLPAVIRKVTIKEVIPNAARVGGSDSTVLYKVAEKANGATIATLVVGDSRQGWAKAYQSIIEVACGSPIFSTDWPAEPEEDGDTLNDVELVLDLSNVRQAGEPLKGFGGTANPVRLEETLRRVAGIVSKARGRQLTAVEVCLLIDEAATAVVAGNIRRSAGMRQFSSDDLEAATAKDNLYSQDEEGNWKVDVEREALKMANHTRCYHTKPDLEEIKDAVTKQFWSGEGAIQYVPEMIARANADLLPTPKAKKEFLDLYNESRDAAAIYLIRQNRKMGKSRMDEKELQHRLNRYGLNPCGEIALKDNLCNLSEIHLNTISPKDYATQDEAFYAGGLQVAALLQHRFTVDRLQYSRLVDPIVGVSFTGLFDFFVLAFGSEWLGWMMEGCPDNDLGRKFEAEEARFLRRWRMRAQAGVEEYCKRHGIRVPNRFTTVQPAGSKSLLTGASPGWHPPKAQRFIRRITFGKQDPLVAALRDYGYNVIPAQSAKDEEGNLLNDIDDPRVREVLVEIPTEVVWANEPGCDQYDLSKLPVKSQWRLYMQVQNLYTTHNTSATLEFRQDEIDTLSELIYDDIQNDGGYISAALLARFDANETFPRLPFEPISKEMFDRRMLAVKAARSTLPEGTTMLDLLKPYDHKDFELKGAAGCDSDKCLSEEKQPTLA